MRKIINQNMNKAITKSAIGAEKQELKVFFIFLFLYVCQCIWCPKSFLATYLYSFDFSEKYDFKWQIHFDGNLLLYDILVINLGQ
jgi:hypothetical protein